MAERGAGISFCNTRMTTVALWLSGLFSFVGASSGKALALCPGPMILPILSSSEGMSTVSWPDWNRLLQDDLRKIVVILF